MTARKIYTISFKKKIRDECKEKPVSKVCSEFGLDEQMVRRWKALFNQNETFRDSSNGSKRLKGGGRKLVIEDLEDAIFDWICFKISKSLVVKRKDIIAPALKLYNESIEFNYEKSFKASAMWLSEFMKRYDLSLGRSTTLFKISDEEIINRALSFKKFVDDSNLSQYDPEFVIAMDETAVNYGE